MRGQFWSVTGWPWYSPVLELSCSVNAGLALAYGPSGERGVQMRVGLIVVVMAGCASRVPATPPDVTPPEPALEQPAAPEPATPRLLTADGAFDCAANDASYGVCDGTEGCIFTYPDGCRATTNACEQVVPLTRGYPSRYSRSGSSLWPPYEVVTFTQGDPCFAVDPECGLDPLQGICEPYVAVPECPATVELAEQAQVFCHHPEQPALRCEYPGVLYTCGQPWRPIGGVQPQPGTYDTPNAWFATPDYDASGCPLTERAQQSRCEPLTTTNGECIAMDIRFSCPSGVWETELLPPRP
jgi:hypothetical protein